MGTKACTKRSYERVKAEIKFTMDRLTNLFNSLAGSKVPLVRGVETCIVVSSPIRSKQPAKIIGLRGESPKVNKRHEMLEFGNSRNAKAWGSRRIHSTAFICRKGSSLTSSKDALLSGFAGIEQLQNLKLAIKENTKINNLSEIMSDPEYLITCWTKIRSKKGSLTPTFEKNDTLDGINEEWFKKTSRTFRNGIFQFKPAQRTYISKSNGERRPLIMPSPKDKIVMEGMRFLLELIYEPEFSEKSYGWRSKRGCFTALGQIKIHFGGTRWFIEGDVSQQFSTINHKILAEILSEKIKDQPFIDLVFKYIKVGFGKRLDEIQPMNTGIIQGGNLSTMLANIYMNMFDQWMEKELMPRFNKGIRRKANPEYTRMICEGKAMNKMIQTGLGDDDQFKRIRYVRYADDFLVGVIGSKKDCESLRDEIKRFLADRLKLILNIEKTKISHAVLDSAKFLGHRIHMTELTKMPLKYNSEGVLTRRSPRLVQDAPLKEVVQKLIEKGFAKGEGQPCRNGKFVNLGLPEIIEHYKSIETGIRQFYAGANNQHRLSGRVHYILKYSCALTIASKMKLRTLSRVFGKYGKDLSIVDDKGRIIISYPSAQGTVTNSHLVAGCTPVNLIEKLSERVKKGRMDLKGQCKLCGSSEDIEFHHIRKISLGKKDWLTNMMAKTNRKQIPVCRMCHSSIHKGKYDGKGLRGN